MFESVKGDPGEDGLKRASIIFYVLAALTGLGTVIGLALTLSGDRSFAPLQLGLYTIFIVLAVLTGRGIENQQPWSRWSAYILGILELLNFPIGTVIGIAILVYITRASRAGLFASGAKAADARSG